MTKKGPDKLDQNGLCRFLWPFWSPLSRQAWDLVIWYPLFETNLHDPWWKLVNCPFKEEYLEYPKEKYYIMNSPTLVASIYASTSLIEHGNGSNKLKVSYFILNAGEREREKGGKTLYSLKYIC